MAKAGADIVGANCLFDPWIGLETVGGKIKINKSNLISILGEEDEGGVGRLQHVPPPDVPAQRLPVP